MKYPTITTTATALRDLLTPVIPFADKGDTLPILTCIRLRGYGDRMTALTTDRYRIAMQRASIPAPVGFEALLPITSAKALLAAFKPSRSFDPDVSLTFEPEQVTVSASGVAFEVREASIAYALGSGEYPKLEKVFAAFGRDTLAQPVGLNPHFLADFAKAAGRGIPMVVRATQGAAGVGPVTVRIGDDFIGAIMPVVRDGLKADLDESWAALVTDVPAKPAARKPRAKKAVAS